MVSLRITHFAKSIEEIRGLVTLLEVNISLIRVNDLTHNKVRWRLFEATDMYTVCFRETFPRAKSSSSYRILR